MGVSIFWNNPYISILKLKGGLVDISIVAATCAILGVWDYRAILAGLAAVMIHSGCDILNDIYDVEIDKKCKPKGAIVSGSIPVKNAWAYMLLLFTMALAIAFYLSPVLFIVLAIGIAVGGIMYSHPSLRFKDRPGIDMADMALCFALESIGVWSIYSPVNGNALIVAAYVFILTFSLTFMKDFKDVAGDVNSLPLMLGTRRAAIMCCALTILPLITLMLLSTKYNFIALAAIAYVLLVAGCIKILLDNPIKEGVKLKNWMILAMIVPNFIMIVSEYSFLLWQAG